MELPAKARPLTQMDIEASLQQLGLARGAVAEVHSSLRSFGEVVGGAAAVVNALMNVVGVEGALVMSAYPVSRVLPLTEAEKARGLLAKVRLFGLDYEGPTGMGAIADEFRHRPGTVLGPGFHRVCAWGYDASRHSQGYNHLLAVDGWVLLIGVDIHRCSCMHTAEAKVAWPQALTDYFRLPTDIRHDYPQAEWFVQYHAPNKPAPEDAWGKVQREAEQRGLIRHGQIGSAECLMFKARPVVDLYEAWLRADPFTLFGVSQGQ
jgi:aminoglycoside N3'-acetyltransferase